jgi:hypothetical protein
VQVAGVHDENSAACQSLERSDRPSLHRDFDLRPFLADAFSKRMSRNLDRELTNTAEWADVTDLTPCDEFAAYELGLWLSKLEKRLRSQSGRDRLSKSLPGVEKAERNRK